MIKNIFILVFLSIFIRLVRSATLTTSQVGMSTILYGSTDILMNDNYDIGLQNETPLIKQINNTIFSLSKRCNLPYVNVLAPLSTDTTYMLRMKPLDGSAGFTLVL